MKHQRNKNKTTIKTIFIAFDQAYYERIVGVWQRTNARGFTAWREVQGRGTKTGDAHFGSHAWPSISSALITIVDDDQVQPILDKLHQMDLATPKLGLRAFVWNVEQSI